MKIGSFAASLREHSSKNVRFVLPEGELISPDFHVTEVGHVVRNFIDCGGTVRATEACLLQAWVANDDPGHRLTAGKLGKIMDLSKKVVPSEELSVEVEYFDHAVSQYRVADYSLEGEEIRFALAHKMTDCLAREMCGVGAAGGEGCGCGETAGKCC